MEAITHAGSCLGIESTEGIVLAAEKKITSKLLESKGPSEVKWQSEQNYRDERVVKIHFQRLNEG